MFTGAVYHHGVSSDFCHAASSHHTGRSLYRHHGEGKYMKHFIPRNLNNLHTHLKTLIRIYDSVLVGLARHRKLRPVVQLPI